MYNYLVYKEKVMLLDLIEKRQSVRKYSTKDIPNEVLKKILKAGYLAPSWMDSQPWKFILVKNQETKKLLSELASHQPHVASANAVIVCVADKDGWDKKEFGEVLKEKGIPEASLDEIFSTPMFYPPLLGENIKLLRTVEQVSYATAYMMLAAKDLGVDSCIIGAISNEATVIREEIIKKVNNTLNLNDNQVIITMITLGYPEAEEPVHKYRKDFDKICNLEKLGQKIDF